MTQQQTSKPQTQRKKQRSKAGKGYEYLAYIIIFLAAYALISLFCFAFVVYSFNDIPDNPDDYEISIIYNDKEIYDLDADEANNEYGLYIPFSYLSEISSFGLAGDGDDITLFVIGTDNRIECTRNSSLITINNNPIRISSPILYDDESKEYLIPVSLLENYVTGIDVSYNSEKMICSISSTVSKTDVALKLLLPEPMKPAYFPDSDKYYTPPEVSDEASTEAN